MPQNKKPSRAQKPEPNGEYKVEKVLLRRVYKGVEQFLVKWKGYGSDQNSWEKRSNLEGCIHFQEFLKNPVDEYAAEKILKRRVYKGVEQFLVKWENFADEENTWERRSNLENCIRLQEFEREQAAAKAKTSTSKELAKRRSQRRNRYEEDSSDDDEPRISRRREFVRSPQKKDQKPAVSTKADHEDLDSASATVDEQPTINFSDGRYFSRIFGHRLRRSDGKMEFMCIFNKETDEHDRVYRFMQAEEINERYPEQLMKYYEKTKTIADESMLDKARKAVLKQAAEPKTPDVIYLD